MITNSDTSTIRNTHCIVCGVAFVHARVGKLYCSNRCKQFGYNHREKIKQVLETKKEGINKQPIVFLIDDYIAYNKSFKSLKRYRELDKKQANWEAVDKEIRSCDKIGIRPRDYKLDSWASSRLTENEDGEFYNLETELDENLRHLDLKDLSLEQWSFIKSIYPHLNNLGLTQLISSLSEDFIAQLNLREDDLTEHIEFRVIKNKYVNHCNLISEGIIRFEKPESKEEE